MLKQNALRSTCSLPDEETHFPGKARWNHDSITVCQCYRLVHSDKAPVSLIANLWPLYPCKQRRFPHGWWLAMYGNAVSGMIRMINRRLPMDMHTSRYTVCVTTCSMSEDLLLNCVCRVGNSGQLAVWFPPAEGRAEPVVTNLEEQRGFSAKTSEYLPFCPTVYVGCKTTRHNSSCSAHAQFASTSDKF